MPATSPLPPILTLSSGGDSSALSPIESKPVGNGAGTPAAAQEFEAFVLQSFIEAMLPEKADSVLGTGAAGAFWKSMLAEQIARELARAGGIGMARTIEAGLAGRSGGDS